MEARAKPCFTDANSTNRRIHSANASAGGCPAASVSAASAQVSISCQNTAAIRSARRGKWR